MKAENFDLSYEWYFANVGSLTVAAFYKNLHGVLTNANSEQDLTNNGVTMPVFTDRPANAVSTGHVDGIEFAYNQFMTFLPDPFDGLGVNFTYTYAESGGVAPLNLNSGALAPGSQPGQWLRRPLHSRPRLFEAAAGTDLQARVNIEGIYEKGPVSFRLAWNWRSRFLLTTRDVIYPFAPMFNDPTSTLDGSFFYSFTDHLKTGRSGPEPAERSHAHQPGHRRKPGYCATVLVHDRPAYIRRVESELLRQVPAALPDHDRAAAADPAIAPRSCA